MFRLCLCVLLFFLLTISLSAQKFTISGYIEDDTTGEKLIGANVFDSGSLKGTITNNYGFYSLTLPKGRISLVYSFVGYQPQYRSFFLQQDTAVNITLKPNIEIAEVKVYSDGPAQKVQSTQISMTRIPIRQIKKLPVLLGETDILKTIQLLPGVQSGTEGASNIYVRGGGPDQNLILLDGVPVYNVNHLFGFLSVFNADAIKNVELLKGGFPARYGGRLSSVIDIRMKEGNNKAFKGSGAIGLISSRLTLEGPLFSDKTSFLVSGRRTYFDILTRPIIKAFENGVDAGYFFYDLNAKINHTFSDKSRLYLSAYSGKDQVYDKFDGQWVEDDVKYTNQYHDYLGWGNLTSALRWNYMFNNKLFSNTTLTYSQYKFFVESEFKEITETLYEENENISSFEYISGITDWSGKIDFDYRPAPDHYIKFGFHNTYHTFRPGVNVFQVSDDSDELNRIDTSFGNADIPANEFDVYMEDDYKITEKLKANLGLHYSGFSVENRFYHSLQPRISARYLFTELFSAKAAYSRMSQYIHLLSNSSIGLPTDLWLPVTKKIQPLQSEQYAMGFFYNWNNKFDISIEGFYKNMDRLIEYKEGASFFELASGWQEKLEIGRGWAYGGEFFLQKDYGKTTGWIGYTLSWSNRQFDNISLGKVFPAKYDRRHDVSIALSHDMGNGNEIGLTWVYGTGNAVTLPFEKYPSARIIEQKQNQEYHYDYYDYNVQHIENRNNYRMPPYHRLDLSYNIHKEKNWGELIWNFSVYNVYNRQNPFFLFFGYENDNRVLKQMSLFPIIPSVGASFKF